MELWNEEQVLLMTRDEVVGLSEWVKRLAQNSIFCSTEFDKRQESVKFQLEELWELTQKEKQRSEDMAKSASDLTKSCGMMIEDLKNEIGHHSTDNDDGLDHVTFISQEENLTLLNGNSLKVKKVTSSHRTIGLL
uniref:Uncharacterized protein n=1 Tax=Romanomermis culicivorax TaxID=13658 RepID=A0A915LAB9_ROMCU